jgi:hypothetical protein
MPVRSLSARGAFEDMEKRLRLGQKGRFSKPLGREASPGAVLLNQRENC